jgi:hypothetical protein
MPMAAMIEVLLILLAATVLAFIAATFICYLAYRLPGAWAGAWASVEQGFAGWEAKEEAGRRRARIVDQIYGGAGKRRSGRGVDPAFVQAAEITKAVSCSLAFVKDAASTCCEIQRFTAQVHGAQEMHDVAWDPVCSDLRRNVLDGIDVALEALRNYPFVDRKILKQRIGLEAIRGTCEDCELLKYSTADAPLLCSPARLLGNLPEAEKG